MSLPNARLPVLGFAAFSGTGKTTLLKQIITLLAEQGLRVGMLKHSHHSFEIDHPGKDSYELRAAGASQMLIGSVQRWALICETPQGEREADLNEMIGRLDQSRLDLILVEGFRWEAFPKIELHRPSLGKPLLHPDDPHIIAIASDQPVETTRPLPQLDLNQPPQVADFVLQYCGLANDQPSTKEQQ